MDSREIILESSPNFIRDAGRQKPVTNLNDTCRTPIDKVNSPLYNLYVLMVERDGGNS